MYIVDVHNNTIIICIILSLHCIELCIINHATRGPIHLQIMILWVRENNYMQQMYVHAHVY